MSVSSTSISTDQLRNTTVTTANVTATLAGTQYSYTLPNNCTGFILRSRGLGKIQLAWADGQTGTTYITIPACASYENNKYFESATIYFQSDVASDIVEIESYSI